MSSSLYSISIVQLLKEYTGGYGQSNEIFATYKLKDYIKNTNLPVRVDAFVFLVCLNGNAQITINLNEWYITNNTYVISFPENIIGVSNMSENFEGYVLFLSIDYLMKISLNLNEVFQYNILIRNQPCIRIRTDEVKSTNSFFNLLYETLAKNKSIRTQNIISGLVLSLMYKISEDIDNVGVEIKTLETKSKDYYYLKFMELLQQNFREQHKIKFYSNQLSLTPKYLSTIVKNVSGLSAAQWISNYIVMEAKTLLKTSDMNIKQIAYYLHFPNPSFFCKYFKNHMGVTPNKFRLIV